MHCKRKNAHGLWEREREISITVKLTIRNQLLKRKQTMGEKTSEKKNHFDFTLCFPRRACAPFPPISFFHLFVGLSAPGSVAENAFYHCLQFRFSLCSLTNIVYGQFFFCSRLQFYVQFQIRRKYTPTNYQLQIQQNIVWVCFCFITNRFSTKAYFNCLLCANCSSLISILVFQFKFECM